MTLTSDDRERLRIRLRLLRQRAKKIRGLLRGDEEETGSVSSRDRSAAIVQLSAALDALELADEALQRWG